MKRIDMDIENIPFIVTACCIFHNMCEMNGDRFNKLWLEGINNSTQPVAKVSDSNSSSSAQVIRNALVDYYN